MSCQFDWVIILYFPFLCTLRLCDTVIVQMVGDIEERSVPVHKTANFRQRRAFMTYFRQIMPKKHNSDFVLRFCPPSPRWRVEQSFFKYALRVRPLPALKSTSRGEED